jgi:hypothetical protein
MCMISMWSERVGAMVVMEIAKQPELYGWRIY